MSDWRLTEAVLLAGKALSVLEHVTDNCGVRQTARLAGSSSRARTCDWAGAVRCHPAESEYFSTSFQILT